MPKSKKPTKVKRGKMRLSDQLRLLVANAEADGARLSRYAICQATGIDQAAMSRFVNGQAGLSVEAIDKLGEYFDLVLVQRQQGSKQAKGQ